MTTADRIPAPRQPASPASPASVAAWSRYWQGGHQSSCDGAAAESALAVWQSTVALLPPGGSLLELGCGNGALLRRLAGQAPAAHLVGIDRADILAGPDLPGVALHGGTAIEQVPFPDAAFDLAISQYAMEYSDWSRGIAEMMRILRPGGHFRLLVHSHASAIVARSRSQGDALRQLLDGPLPAALDAAMRALADAAQAGSGDTIDRARAATARFAALLDQAAAAPWGGDAGPMVAAALDAMRAAPRAFAAMPPDAAQAAAEELHRRLADQQQRFADLERAALDPPALARLVARLEQCGGQDIDQRAAKARSQTGALAETGVWISGTRGKQ